jgi:hypothetical protein
MSELSDETLGLCWVALSMLNHDVDLTAVGEYGVVFSMETDSLREVLERWPHYGKFASQAESGAELAVPPAAAKDVVRAFAKAVMS